MSTNAPDNVFLPPTPSFDFELDKAFLQRRKLEFYATEFDRLVRIPTTRPDTEAFFSVEVRISGYEGLHLMQDIAKLYNVEAAVLEPVLDAIRTTLKYNPPTPF